MMLHEAVMLEIYRQALHASEMASPRCQSRESSGGGRCPSDESIRSEGDRDGHNSGNNMSPVSITLPPTLPPAAAAALLPQHSAAMAAYLNAAAVAAQQNRLLLGSPLAGLAAARNGSPPILPPLASPTDESDDAVLDFSKKRSVDDRGSAEDDDGPSDCEDGDAVNLSAKSGDNSPLDLSVSTRKRTGDDSNSPPPRKTSRPLDYKPAIVTPWSSPVPPQLPYFAAAVAAASLSPKNNHNDWNGKHKGMTNESAKALEKMTELSRFGGEEIYRPPNNNASGGGAGGATAGGGRHSAWQSHWLNKGADSAKDVLKCVWCKQSFPSLAALTTHMKETKHCGVNVPPGTGMPQQQMQPQPLNSSAPNHERSASNKPSPSELNLLIKETMPLPRKLVRGQDVWLGKGAEQTRQILKCMWCGQSFRTLAEMTSHMQQTQHYTNIISQEQIISWKSSDGDKPGGPPGPSGGGNNAAGAPSGSTNAPAAQTNSHVSAVLTCKVCDQAFSSLKELSNHMVKNAHYKEHIMRSITESGGRRRQTREKRKKSLPVRKLLEMERAQHDFKNGENPTAMPQAGNKPIRDLGAGKITCEKCNEKIETTMFVDHIRQCIGGTAILQAQQQREKLKNALLSNTIIPPDSISPVTPTSRDGRKSVGDDLSSPLSLQKSPMPADLSSPASSTKKDGAGEKSSSPSVLNAIEQLIEKSFDTRSRHPSTNFGNQNQSATPLGSSILKRLGIDESVDYTKPLVDPQTMNLLRSYHQQQYVAQFGRRERSGSESSSISERGSSRVDSLTPEKKFDTPSHSTPRGTPEKQYMDDHNNSNEQSVNIKREMHSDDEDEGDKREPPKIKIKKEIDDDEEEGPMRPPSKSNEDISEMEKRRNSVASSPAPSPRLSTASVPLSPSASPISDHHSIASRSTPGVAASDGGTGSKKSAPVSSSLGALSSMFDSLTGSNSATNTESGGGGKKSSAHPLAALQKLCDKTENTPTSRGGASSALLSATTNTPASRTAPGAILAFSWACNDAVVSDESVIKCAYCDTTFTSKGAYRHHLSKAHFVNDDVIPDPKGQQLKPGSPHSPKSTGSGQAAGGSGRDSVNRSDGGGHGGGTPIPPTGSQSKSPPPVQSPAGSGGGFDESPHSKFLKYTELAKQLSSKYV